MNAVMTKLKSARRAARDVKHAYALVRVGLTNVGWVASREARRPVDAKGHPVPWFTYSATHFLNARCQRDFRVFEYGSGMSTLWWAERAAQVVSCEHKRRWYKQLSKRAPSNVTLLHRSVADGEYLQSIVGRGPFDVVVVDGEERIACARQAVTELSSAGVVVWDNANRTRYREGYDFLHEHGFKRLDFYGFGPIWVIPWMTSIFYRQENCLDI